MFVCLFVLLLLFFVVVVVVVFVCSMMVFFSWHKKHAFLALEIKSIGRPLVLATDKKKKEDL
jgi:hypothetical protein